MRRADGTDSPRSPAGGSGLAIVPWTVGIFAVVMAGEWLLPYLPGSDDSKILEAAKSLVAGRGLVHSGHDDLSDLSQPLWTYVGVDWPPVYPLLAALLIASGLSIVATVHAVQAVAIPAGIVGWLLLAKRVLAPPWDRFFAAWVLIVLFADRASETNLILWSIMPWIVMALVHTAGPEGRRAAWLVGALVSLAIGLRYAAIFLAPAAATFIAAKSHLSVRERAYRVAFASVLPSVTLLLLSVTNRAFGGQTAFTEQYEKGFFPGAWFLHATPLRALFAQAFGLDRLTVQLGLHVPDAVIAFLEVLIAGLLVWIALRAFRAAKPAMTSEQGNAVLATACLFGWLLLMLGALTARHGVLPAITMRNWTFLGHERYYSEVVPAVALVWLLAVSRVWPRPPVIAARIAIVAALALASAGTLRSNLGSKRVLHMLKGDVYGPDIDTVREYVRALTGRDPDQTVLFDHDLASRYVEWIGVIRFARFPAADRLARMGSMRPVRLIAVVPEEEPDLERRQKARALVAAFDLPEVGQGERSARRYRIYSAVRSVPASTATRRAKPSR